MAVSIQDLEISSQDFAPNGPMDDRHSQDRGNESPTLVIEGAPQGTAELAVICHDPDAPLPRGFTHWLLYGIPADVAEIGPDADDRYRPGVNDFGEAGYGGPRPPEGHGEHHYYFWVYALSRPVEGTPSRPEFLEQYADAILEQNRVKGVYQR